VLEKVVKELKFIIGIVSVGRVSLHDFLELAAEGDNLGQLESLLEIGLNLF
jgi:hypothetical protein